MSDFSALHVAMSGLKAAQLKMDTASNNIANANTVGYTRQRVDLKTRYPNFDPAGQVGSGVDVENIVRIRDTFLDGRVRSASAALAETDVRADFLSRAELITGEPDIGVTASLDRLWGSFEDLALDPTDRTSRQAVLDELGTFTTLVNQIASGLEGLREGAVESAQSTISEVNGTLAEIARLNVVILDASAEPGTPNDLMDQRDRLIDEVSRQIGANVITDPDGAVRVSLNGLGLVTGSDHRPLSIDPDTGIVTHPSGVAVSPGGELGGYLSVYHDDVPQIQSRLDTFASETADAINTVHQAGYHTSGAGGPMLSYDPLDPARSLTVAITDTDEIATAASAGPPFAPFDATIPENLADLRKERVVVGGTATIGESYRSFVAALGQSTASALSSAVSQQGLVDAAERSRQSSHGVSVDEEMVHLMEAQRMYEAAARVITSVDQALDTVINRMGMVGR